MLRGAPLLFVTIVLSIGQMTVAQNTTPNPAGRWLSHIQYLASDELAGRETGSEGHRRAAEYVAAAFKRAGLKPGGTQGYFQPVKFISRKLVEEQSSLAIIRSPKGESIARSARGARLDIIDIRAPSQNHADHYHSARPSIFILPDTSLASSHAKICGARRRRR